METKNSPLVSIKVIDESKGEVQAVFSTLKVVDKDKDVTLPGAFGEQSVRISAYNHQSWSGELPIGKGTIRENGNEAVLTGRFFMDVPKARDTFVTIKELDDLMEWSYGYDILERSEGMWPEGDEKGEQVQFLKKLKVHEVSPVILGAGENTRTLSAKAAKAAKGPIPYSETGTTDVNWDGSMMRRRCSAASAPLRALHAWMDSSGDANSKSSYKFPHHMVAENGAVGAANTRACAAAIAVLNGGRGGSSIPEDDRKGVYAHVSHHMKDAGKEPPPLKNWIEYQEARKEAIKQQMPMEDAQTMLGHAKKLTNMLSDAEKSLPALSEVQSVVSDMMDCCGMGDSDAGDSGTSSLDFSAGVKLFDHLAWAYTELEIVSDRVAKASAQRAENGQKLSDQSLDVVKMILSECERLREALASEPPRDNPHLDQLIEQNFRNARALLHLSERSEFS